MRPAHRSWPPPVGPGRRRSAPSPCRRRSRAARGRTSRPGPCAPTSRPRSGPGPSYCSARTAAHSAARRSASSLSRCRSHSEVTPASPNGKLPRNTSSFSGMRNDRLDAAFDAWVQAQTAALDVVRQATGVPESDVDMAEGYRWVTRLTRLILDWIVEKSDPLHPQLFDLQDEYKKLLVDNPDVHYTFCVLDDSRTYRLVGQRGECAYLGMTFGTPFGQGPVGGRTGTQTQTNIDEFELGPNGEVDILIAPGRGHARPEAAQFGHPRTGDGAAGHPGDLLREAPGPVRPSPRRAGARSGRGRAAPHPLDGGAGLQTRVRRHVPDLRRRDGAADVAGRGEQHQHVRRRGRLCARRGAGGRGAHPLQRGDDVPRRTVPSSSRARRWS